MAAYDLIGDIHGHLAPLETLLTTLGYRPDPDNIWRHPSRQVIFLGDFVDRGPDQREVVRLARDMVTAGSALSVMGNHEFNALAFHTKDEENGGWLRQRSDKNIRQHLAFINAYLADRHLAAELEDTIAWFLELPVFLDLGNLRVVHACWDPDAIATLAPRLAPGNRLTPALLADCCRRDSPEFDAIETLLKGKEITLPEERTFYDKDNVPRRRIRIRWWEQGDHTYRSLFMGPLSAETHIPDEPVSSDHLIEYGREEPPVFLGHYWLEGQPAPLTDNVACLDYSVAKPGGKLVAYRWDGEQTLTPDKFVSVPV